MEIGKILLFLLGGLGVLSWGADLFVNSASHFARRLGVSPVIIGLTVVAFGTSAPELAVNVLSAFQNKPDIAMGNVVGSNIFNIAFILGICATISPLMITSQLIRIDIPIMTVASAVLWIFAQNFQIGFIEGLIFFIGIILYTVLQIRLAKKEKDPEGQFEKEFSEKGSPAKDLLILVGGLGLLIGGAHYFVEGAILGARMIGLSEAVIGLTIVAAGTSLPEVATSVAATLKGERDIAIGNVVGSNIFNILSVIGLSGIITGNLPVSEHMARVDTTIMVLITLVMVPFSIWRKKIDRALGIVLFASWCAYTWYLVVKN